MFASAHAPPRSRAPAPFTQAEPTPVRGRISSLIPYAGSVPPPQRALPWSRVLLAAAVLSGMLVGVLLALRPTNGTLIVTASGTRGELHDVEVYVDGQKRCDQVPCTLNALPAGSHLVRTKTARLSDSAERAVVVEAGETLTHHVELGEVQGMAVLRIAADGDVRVSVDGRDLGAPPVNLDEVDPGEHVVKVSGRSGYFETYEEKLTLRPGEVRSIGPLRLKVLKARLRVEAGEGSDGASVKVDGRTLALPATVDVNPDEPHEVVATKAGSADFSEQVVFSPGEAERTVRVEIDEAGAAPRPARMSLRSGRRSAQAVRKPIAEAKSTSGSQGMLNLNSIPVSSVIVDGRPLGRTPLTGVKVSEGSHTVVFVHPDLGRKITTAVVPAGGRATASVRFQ